VKLADSVNPAAKRIRSIEVDWQANDLVMDQLVNQKTLLINQSRDRLVDEAQPLANRKKGDDYM
jgi:hypothetical protein